ncbi:bifunctional diguanylate cyclase/phosphodiesterase [Cupriavidus sp. AU9028]|uniref:putative bifunctional diguanylate cyclase/phosphodiesterase n=1 Tax=Cupriavidus sp. AU9028 TaxID=2871157 RepID=UPI001C94BF14|nr:bifunctional diguanylate cyclase/phosphodiesterase [Cupriavidus sp. AU9028]MBY4898418.1 bifunctional diguanylate cyclase/phosphodiesterase [Cupriavidus sp. AU9028]
MSDMSISVLLLAALMGLAAGLGLLGGRDGHGRLVRLFAVATGLVAQALVGLPFWAALASGVVPGTRKLGEAFVSLIAGLIAAYLLDWFQRGVLYWRGAAMVATMAGATLIAGVGVTLGRQCGGSSGSAVSCLNSNMVHPGWFALGLALLATTAFVLLMLLQRRQTVARGDPEGDELHLEGSERGALAPAGGAPLMAAGAMQSLLPLRMTRRPGRAPGQLTVRATGRGHAPVGEYRVATELPDRTAFARWLDKSMAQARLSETSCAVLLVHIADFREVDEVFEVRADDILAQDVGALAQAVLEPHDFLARLARDEFAVGVPAPLGSNRAQEVSARLLLSLGEFVAARGLQMQIGINIGIAIHPRDAQSSEALLQAARVSLAEARESGSNQVRTFNTAAGERARRLRVIRRDLWLAIQDDGLSLEYQGKFAVDRRTLIGAEALCRWRHPTLGAVNPAEFIMVAEQSGQIDKLDDWVIASVCRQVRQWQDAGLPVVPVAINVSGLRFASRDFPNYLLDQIHQHDIPPSAITLEITETAAMKDIAQSLETLVELQARGIHVALDDFGSGYSSLGYLKRLRVGTLKIDRTLIGGLESDAQGRAIVSSMIALAHELRMRVVAEGVESAAQLDILARMGCDEVQGYLLARPVEATAFAALLADPRPVRL